MDEKSIPCRNTQCHCGRILNLDEGWPEWFKDECKACVLARAKKSRFSHWYLKSLVDQSYQIRSLGLARLIEIKVKQATEGNDPTAAMFIELAAMSYKLKTALEHSIIVSAIDKAYNDEKIKLRAKRIRRWRKFLKHTGLKYPLYWIDIKIRRAIFLSRHPEIKEKMKCQKSNSSING